jgi:hypothetical protein
MSLDFYLMKTMPTSVFSGNCTHNLTEMAAAANLYKPLWHPEQLGYTKAHELIPALTRGLKDLVDHPAKYKAFDPVNGWGSYDGFVKFTANVLDACVREPDADIQTST